jgi:hypothetical protein
MSVQDAGKRVRAAIDRFCPPEHKDKDFLIQLTHALLSAHQEVSKKKTGVEMVDEFVAYLLEHDEDGELWERLTDKICHHCGGPQPRPGYCQCWNDE